MKSMSKILLVTVVSAWASGAFAFFDASLHYGSRTSTVSISQADGTDKNKDLKGTDMGATFLLDPIPVIPVAFGIKVVQGTTKMDDVVQEATDQAIASDATISGAFTGKGTGTSKTMFYGPVLKVWAPIPFVKPYLKAAYLLGAETIDETVTLTTNAGVSPAISVSAKPKTVYSHTGSEIALGMGYSPVKLTSLFVEYSIHSGKRKAKSMSGEVTTTVGGASASTPYTSADLSDEEKKDKTWNAKTINIGVSVGI